MLAAGHGILGLAWVTVGADVVEMAVKAAWAFRIEPGLRIAPSLATAGRCRALMRYGGAALLVSLAQLLIWRTDAIVIGATLGAEAVAVFAVGSKLPTYARSLTTAASRVLTPAATRLEALGDRAGLLRMLGRGSRSMLLVGGAILAYLLGVGEPFLVRWQSAEFRGEAVAVLVALTVGAVGPIAAYPFEAVLYGAGRVRLLGILSVVEAAANLTASLLLARPLGVVGVALGTTVPSLVIRLLGPAGVRRARPSAGASSRSPSARGRRRSSPRRWSRSPCARSSTLRRPSGGPRCSGSPRARRSSSSGCTRCSRASRRPRSGSRRCPCRRPSRRSPPAPVSA